MLEKAKELLEESDSFATIQYLNRQGNPQEVVQSYNDLVRHLFWEKKNVPAVINLSIAGIQYGLAAADSESDPREAARLTGRTRAVAYNLASFTWPGWEDEGIELGVTESAIGYDAAKLVLRLVAEADDEPIRFCRAHWMLGAHQLEAGESARALASFQSSAEYARAADSRAEELLAQGFAVVAELQHAKSVIDRQEELQTIRDQLSQEEHGEAFLEQIETALRIYG